MLRKFLEIFLAKMRCGRLLSIDIDDTMANNFSQAVFFRTRKTFLNEETISLSVNFVLLAHVSVSLLFWILLCLVSVLS